MPNYMVVDSNMLDNDLYTIASAIRTKGGTTAPLLFPSGMTQAISDLQGIPSQLSGIVGGEWTQATTIRVGGIINITHGLGKVPDFILIKSDYPTFIPTISGAALNYFCIKTQERLIYGLNEYSTSGAAEYQFSIVQKKLSDLTIDQDGNYDTGTAIVRLVGPYIFQLRSGSADPVEAGTTFKWIVGCFA